jgi:hypothetical protein
LKFIPSNFLGLISDEPNVEAICRESLYVILPEVVTTVNEYHCIAIYPKYDITELGMNVKGVTFLLGVITSMSALSEVCTNRVVEV